jgi:hypothetical protein
MPREIKILIALIIMIALSLWITVIARAESGFKEVETWKAEDSEMYVRSFGDSTPRLALAACYGPFLEYRRNDRWLADFGSVCGVAIGDPGAASTEEGNSVAAGGIQLFNLFGVRGTVAYDPFGNAFYWGLGISATGLVDQLLK